MYFAEVAHPDFARCNAHQSECLQGDSEACLQCKIKHFGHPTGCKMSWDHEGFTCWVDELDGEVPDAPWALPRDVLKSMNGMLSEMKFPSHYDAGLRESTSIGGSSIPIGLKSHDYHKMMHCQEI